MNVQWCKKHPGIDESNFRYSKFDDRMICRLCRAEIAKGNYQANKEKIKERTKKWRKANPHKILEYRKRERDRLFNELSKPYFNKNSASKVSVVAFNKLKNILITVKELKSAYKKLKRY